MVNNKHSRKNSKQVKQVPEKPKAEDPAVASDDDGFGCVLIKSIANNRNVTRSNKKKRESAPPPPPPPVPEWEQMGMSEEEFVAFRERMVKQMLEWQMEDYKRNLLAEYDSIAYWENSIERLERSRERYNKKWGWSADDVAAVGEIDADIKECQENIARIEGMYGDQDDLYYECEDEIDVC